ncbi:DUF1660 family phage protein [Paenibacillus spongiae]
MKLKCRIFGHKKSNISSSYLWNGVKFTCVRCGQVIIN